MYYIEVPDNDKAFYAYVNLVVNNRDNWYKANPTNRPRKIGPVQVTYQSNEVGEQFMVCKDKREQNFLDMVVDQFCLLRTHWGTISKEVEYENSSRY